MAQRFLRIFETNKRIPNRFDSREAIEFANFFRKTGFLREAIELLNQKIEPLRLSCEVFGYSAVEAEEVSDLLYEAKEVHQALAQEDDARSCLKEIIAVWKSCDVSAHSTIKLLFATRRLAWFEESYENSRVSMKLWSQWLEILQTRMKSLLLTHYSDGRPAARIEILGMNMIRLAIDQGMFKALKVGDSNAVSTFCDARIEYYTFCHSVMPETFSLQMICTYCSHNIRTLRQKGFHTEAQRLATYAGHLHINDH